MTETGAVPGVLKRELNRLLKQAWETLGIYWHANFREKHFTHAGATEYQYDKRQGEDRSQGGKGFFRTYTGRKLRRFGHTLPLVWSGASRTRSRIRDVRATRAGVRVVINAPTLNFRKGRLATGKTMREEMTTVSAKERRDLAVVHEKALKQGIEDIREVRRWETAF